MESRKLLVRKQGPNSDGEFQVVYYFEVMFNGRGKHACTADNRMNDSVSLVMISIGGITFSI